VDCADSDEVLAARARTDREAFGILYERHLRRLYSYIYYRTGNAADAEELTARTFHRALANIHRYEPKGVPFSAWLYRVAHNLVANWHRDSKRHRALPIDDAMDIPNPADDPHGAAVTAEERRELRAAIAALPADRQRLLILKFVESMPNADIAVVMGRSEGAVKALLHRTVVTLKTQLSPTKAVVR
jgi:RNA polymerase sigma-70 factor (ECF subfamily)